MKKICFVCSSKLPQPPVLGGAVPTLIQHIIDENEVEKDFSISCVSVYNEKAAGESKNYSNAEFSFIKMKKIDLLLDKIICLFLNIIKKTNKIYSWGFLFRTIRFKKGVSKVLKKNRFDFVVFENSIPVLFCLKNKKLLKKYDGKFYYHTHCVPRKAFGSGKLLSKAKSVICVSKFVEKETISRFKKFNIKTSILYNCVDTSIFKPIGEEKIVSWRESIGLLPNDFAVGFIGRMTVDKGIIQLIQAIKMIGDTDVKLVIVGSTFYGSNTKDRFVHYLKEVSEGIIDRIIFTGYMENKLTPLFYCGCDVICLPPIWEEPGAVTNIEAAACGCPIISTYSGGNEEYIGGKSVLLEKNDKAKLVSDIANQIRLFKTDSNFKNSIAKSAYNWGSKQTKKEYYCRFKEVVFDSTEK